MSVRPAPAPELPRSVEKPTRGEEVRTLLKIAAPLAAAYLAELAMGLTTKSIVGQLGYRELAAIGLATMGLAEAASGLIQTSIEWLDWILGWVTGLLIFLALFGVFLFLHRRILLVALAPFLARLAEGASPFEAALDSGIHEDIREALGSLTPREAKIIHLRYGLRDGREHTLEEVGRKYGLTRERIRQIIEIWFLREPLLFSL